MTAFKITSTIFLLAIVTLCACQSYHTTNKEVVLLYGGEGTSRNSVRAIEMLIEQCGFRCVTVDSAEIEDMTDEQLSRFRLIAFPGGNFIEMGNGLTTETAQRLRQAVSNGASYLGICAGGLLAGDAECTSFDFTNGVKFGFYDLVNRDVHKEVVPIVDANAHSIEHYWEDGPQFSGWGEVVAKYPDATPAVVVGSFGKGRVVLCGVHPEAPASWRKGMAFTSSADEANEFGKLLIHCALSELQLPLF